MSTPVKHQGASTLTVPGATITYDVRVNADADEPALFLIGSPMGAAGFTTLAGHFPDRTVVTYDPRGVERSKKDEVTSRVDPNIHGDDLSRVIDAIGGGPVDLFASSGGAVNALALVARHSEKVRTLIAHEPPLASLVPDRDAALAACRAVAETYQQKGFGNGMAHFIALISYPGPIPDGYASQPAPSPASFGLPEGDDGSRDDPLLAQNMISCTHYEPEFGSLRSSQTRIVVAVGAESGETLARRTAIALADQLGLVTTILPGDHGGFLGGEYGQRGDPDAFGPALRQQLTG